MKYEDNVWKIMELYSLRLVSYPLSIVLDFICVKFKYNIVKKITKYPTFYIGKCVHIILIFGYFSRKMILKFAKMNCEMLRVKGKSE